MTGPSEVPPSVVLVSGIPGAGKTTVARLLAEELPRSVHLEGDIVSFRFVVGGLAHDPTSPEWHAQTALRRRNLCLLANSFASSAFSVVIDDVVVAPEALAVYEALLAPRPLRLVQLTPDLEVAQARDAAREKPVLTPWLHLDAEMRHRMPRVGLWLDTSRLSVRDTVNEVLRNWDAALIGSSLE